MLVSCRKVEVERLFCIFAFHICCCLVGGGGNPVLIIIWLKVKERDGAETHTVVGVGSGGGGGGRARAGVRADDEQMGWQQSFPKRCHS